MRKLIGLCRKRPPGKESQRDPSNLLFELIVKRVGVVRQWHGAVLLSERDNYIFMYR